MLKYELQNIISGKSEAGKGNLIQTIAHYLEDAKKQVQKLKEQSTVKKKKQSA